MKTTIVTFLIAMSVMAFAETYEQRLADSTTVLHEMSQASDKGIPQDLLQKAQCVVVVPGLKKVAFVGGGKYGRGYASCLTKKEWSGPAAVRIGAATDKVCVQQLSCCIDASYVAFNAGYRRIL